MQKLFGKAVKAPLAGFVLLYAGYAGLIWLAPPAYLSAAVSGWVISMAVFVCVAYGPYAVSPSVGERQRQVQFLSLGICLAWSATAALRIWSLIYLYQGKPEWMEQHYISSLLTLTIGTAGFFHLIAPVSLVGAKRQIRWGILASAGLLGAVIASGLLLFAR